MHSFWPGSVWTNSLKRAQRLAISVSQALAYQLKNLRICILSKHWSLDCHAALTAKTLGVWNLKISKSRSEVGLPDPPTTKTDHIPLAKKSLLLWNCWNQRVPVGYVAMARNDGAQTSGEKDWEIQLGWERCDRHVYCTTVDSRWHISFLQVYDTRPSRNTSWSTDIRQEQLDTLDMHV